MTHETQWTGLKLKTILLSLAILIVAGCSTSGCPGFKPIRPSQNDIEIISDDLVTQILEHNQFGERACYWKP